MNSRRGELIRRHTRHLSRNNSYGDPNTDDDSENSRCPSPLLTVEAGYRVDPFMRYPVARVTRGVRFMADYYIQIWAPQQAQASSVQNGRNALLALILPLAFQNSMLFEATIAMTRAAWVLRRGTEPFADKMLLRHRGTAMKELRDVLVAPHPPSQDLVLLTMSTFLTLNYMIDDVESFEVHLRALESMLATTTGDGDVRNFVQGRALAFGVMASFLRAHQPSYASRINEKGHRISTLTYPGHPFSPDLCAVIARLPEGFAEVALSRCVAIEIISFLARLTELITWIATREGPADQSTTPPPPPPATDESPASAPGPTPTRPDMTIQRAIYDLQCLSALPLTPPEGQMVRALLAFCLHLYNQTSFHIPLARPLRPVLEAFNENTELPRPPWLQRCLYWCAVVVASAWDTQMDASPERHVVLDRLAARLPEARCWADTEDLMRKFLWLDRLADEWEVCWRAAAFRSRRQRRGASQIASAFALGDREDAGGVADAFVG
ncbi:hypothetical protein CLCR_09985 [Cladophialophora carrionii]|uniref:Uncharacterized protein n=1 Tax=Cladophialophora carrionii TaxID=86049 RepID=A0A1C1CW72_9EURO|nr:hypothetical protein CLCR_09985 [Cladophialophora carrionii]